MKNVSNIEYVRNLTQAQKQEVIKELALVFKSGKTKPVLKACKPTKKV